MEKFITFLRCFACVFAILFTGNAMAAYSCDSQKVYTSCSSGYYLSNSSCIKCPSGCDCSSGSPVCCSTSKACPSGYSGTYNECNNDAGSKCSRSCSVKCSGNDTSDCPSGASCSYNTNYSTTGTQYYGGSCSASVAKCPLSSWSCYSGDFYSGGSCWSCSGESYVYDSGYEDEAQEEEEDCETENISNGTRTRCRYRYRTPYRSYTETCYYSGGGGGTSGVSSCTGATRCSTSYGSVIYPSWGSWGNYGNWSYSCNSGYSVSGSSCVCTTSCSSRNNTSSTRSGTESCTITNGTGSRTYTDTCNGKYESGCYSANSSSCSGCSSWGRTTTGTCTVQSCNKGYQVSGNTCACTTNCTSVKNTTDTQACTPNNSVANAKTTSCPKGTQTCTGNYTNNACQSAGAQCTGCSGYGSCSTSCSATSCNTGYYLSSGTCAKCDEGYTSADGNAGNRNSCYKSCTVPCNPQTCPENATCTHGKETSSGTQNYGGTCNATAQACTITITCKAGYYLKNGKCETCSTGKFCTGNNAETSCPANYPNSAAGATKRTDCYSNNKSRSWTGVQNEPTLPSGCNKYSTTACNKPACNYTVYSNADGTGDGAFRDGCQTNADACTKTIASVEASSGHYVNGITCPTCTSANATYPSSDGGAIGSGRCYSTQTVMGTCTDAPTPDGCDSATRSSGAQTSCTWKKYADNTGSQCNPGACTNPVTGVTAKNGYYANTATTCTQCPSGASGSDAGATKATQCYISCSAKNIAGGSTTVVRAKEYYVDANTKYPACTFNVTCNEKYGAHGNGTTDPSCAVCDTGTYSAGGANVQCTACTNGPANSSYTSNSNANTCAWQCNDKYGQTFDNACVALCTAGMSTLHAGEKVAVRLYDTRHTTPSIVIQKGEKVCYGNLVSGQATGALNVDYKGTVYHTSN